MFTETEKTKDSLNVLSDVKYIFHDPAKKISAIRLKKSLPNISEN